MILDLSLLCGIMPEMASFNIADFAFLLNDLLHALFVESARIAGISLVHGSQSVLRNIKFRGVINDNLDIENFVAGIVRSVLAGQNRHCFGRYSAYFAPARIDVINFLFHIFFIIQILFAPCLNRPTIVS